MVHHPGETVPAADGTEVTQRLLGDAVEEGAAKGGEVGGAGRLDNHAVRLQYQRPSAQGGRF